MAAWIQVRCSECDGRGVVAHYSHNDFEGPAECRRCDGRGLLWLSEHDRIADCPGGPLRGSWPGRYAEAIAAAHQQQA